MEHRWKSSMYNKTLHKGKAVLKFLHGKTKEIFRIILKYILLMLFKKLKLQKNINPFLTYRKKGKTTAFN